MDSLCGGKLLKPEKHEGAMNTHRFCIKTEAERNPLHDNVFDLQVNSTDLDWFRWIFVALDKKKTSWLSARR